MAKNNDAVDALWAEKVQDVRAFVDAEPIRKKLSEEVSYILETALRKEKIEFAHVVHRAKTLASFCEKIRRRSYENPLREMTDLAGVRVVFLYLSDRSRIEALIYQIFEVLERSDTVRKADPDRFGYGALHFIVKLRDSHSGARYDELKGLVCELQVRSILQDAWAIVGHHLSYKQESDVPSDLQRKLNALSGLFETADDQFDALNKMRLEYAQRIELQISKQGAAFNDAKLNLDNLIGFLKWRYPKRERMDRSAVSELLQELTTAGFQTLNSVKLLVDWAEKAVDAHDRDPSRNDYFTGVGCVRISLYFWLEKRDGKAPYTDIVRSLYTHLLKDNDEEILAALNI